MKLYIAEKPSVAKDIANAIGKNSMKNGYIEIENGDCVTWCIGHIIKSKEPEAYNPNYAKWDLKDLPLKLFPVQYEPIADKKEQVKTVVDLIKQADVIVNAGDVDDEGQLLVDEVIIYSEVQNKPIYRLLINDNTDEAIKKALNNLQDNKKFRGMFNKALARSVGDNIYGFSMTRFYTIKAQQKGYKGTLSVGRVQTPVLGMITKRYLDNTSHKEATYQTITADFETEKGIFSANWSVTALSPVDEKGRLNSEDFAKKLCDRLTNQSFKVTAHAIDKKEKEAPLPYNLLKLQQEMSKKYKYTANKTLEITQSLRENHKAITYNRSDCQYLSDEQYTESPDVVNALLNLSEFNSIPCDLNIKSSAFNSSNITAHTAIIPTKKTPDLDKLSAEEKNVYNAIAKRFLMQFLPKMKYDEVSISLVHEDEKFSKRSRKITDLGFTQFDKEVAQDEEETKTDDDFNAIASVKNGADITAKAVNYKNVKTKPPELFTESTLLSAITRVADFVEDDRIKKLLKDKDKGKKGENGGIGTPATRDKFVPLLVKRGLITIEKQKLIPTQAGIEFYNTLPKLIVQPDMTALWAEKQVEIERGTLSVTDFINSLYDDIVMLTNDDVNVTITGDSQIETLEGLCPACKSRIVIKPKLYVCENKSCEFKIWNVVADKKISQSIVESILKKGISSEIKGFKSKAGKEFSAKLALEDQKTGKLSFKFEDKKNDTKKKA